MVHAQVTFFPHPSMELSACTIWHAFIGPFSRKMARMMVLLFLAGFSYSPVENYNYVSYRPNHRSSFVASLRMARVAPVCNDEQIVFSLISGLKIWDDLPCSR